MRVFDTVASVVEAVGEELGASDWVTIDQARIDLFAESTGDHQWIHVDPVRALAGPFGSTIAHGYLTLSLIPALSEEIFELGMSGPKLNYGINKVRFPSPVPVGSRVRAHVDVVDAIEAGSGTQVVIRTIIEIEGTERPACVAETVILLLAPTT